VVVAVVVLKTLNTKKGGANVIGVVVVLVVVVNVAVVTANVVLVDV